jgi:hypothetical protein
MTKEETIKQAAMKATVSKQDQVMFRTFDGSRLAGERFVYDYTSTDYWPCRRNRKPASIIITTVKYVPMNRK